MGAASITMNEAAEWQPAVNPWIIAIAVTLATFMEVLDTSIANVALPHIAGSLSAGTDESTWVLTSYLVSNAIVLPLSGWLSSIIGRKRFYMGCVALFTISSFLCGFAPNLPMLIFFRILQGAGGGGLQPSEQAILADTFPPAKRGMAFAVYGIAVVMAPAIGPTLGGWITDNFSWRWIFFVNIPVGILSLMLTSRLIQDPPYFKRRKLGETRIDYTGLGFVALGLGTLQVVLDKGQRDDWFESPFILWLTVISVASLVFVIFWEWYQKDPIIDLHLFRQPTFAAANFLMFMLGFALLGSTLLLPLFMQTLLGYTAEQAGKALSPGGFAIMMMLPPGKNNAASGLMNLARNIGGSVGISFVTTLLARRTQFHQARLSENLSGGSAPLQSTLHGLTAKFMQGGLDAATATQKAYAMVQANVIRQATMLGYVDCFWLLGVVIICLVPVVFLMKKAKPGGPMAAH